MAGTGCGSPPEGRDPSPAGAAAPDAAFELLGRNAVPSAAEFWPRRERSRAGCAARTSLCEPRQLGWALGLPRSSRRGDRCPNPELGLTKRCPQGAPSSEDTTSVLPSPVAGEELSLREEHLGGRGGPGARQEGAAPPAPAQLLRSSRGRCTRKPPPRARGQKIRLLFRLGEVMGPAHPLQAWSSAFRANPWLCSHLHSHARGRWL